MFFWQTKDNPWIEARKARKNPPILITMLLCALLFWGYMYLAFYTRELIYNVITKIVNSMVESGALKNNEIPLFDDISAILFSIPFIFLVPIGLLYAKFIEGRSSRTFALEKENRVNRFFTGFLIGTIILAAILGFLAIFNIYSVKGIAKFNWLSFVSGFISICIWSFSIEYFFRGALLSSFGAKNHPLTAILASSIFYALCMYFYYNNLREMNFFLIVDHLLLGCLLGVVVYRTKTVWTSIGIRFGIMLFSQIILGIPFSGYSYEHGLFTSKYTTASIWFTTKLVQGIDTGFCMFVMLIIALALAVFIPVKAADDDKNKYFRHVGSEEQEIAGIDDINNDIEETKTVSEDNSADEQNEEEWDEEETRDIGTPNYRAPEDYLKK